MAPPRTHYLDFAATSAIRPPTVAQAMGEAAGLWTPDEVQALADSCRRALAEVLRLPGPEARIAFFQNATQAINVALWGLLRPRDVVVLTAFDHNAVLRPAAALAQARAVEVRTVPGRADGSLDDGSVDRLLEGARLLVVNSASNVLGTRLPVRALTRRARDAGATVLVDAAQGAGRLPERWGEVGADMVAFTGHKGLLGPPGIGGLWVREGLELEPLLRGGAVGDVIPREMPRAMPHRLEAGTLNAPGIAGLLAGLEEVRRRGVAALHRHEAELKDRMRLGLARVPGVRILSPPAPDGVGIVTLVASPPASVLAERLWREWQVRARAGLHGAPETHRMLKTLEGGALRLSVGWASTVEDVDRAVEGIAAIQHSDTCVSSSP